MVSAIILSSGGSLDVVFSSSFVPFCERVFERK